MYDENYLAHYGILGMHWGIRRYQNKDGSLTAEGRKRRGFDSSPRHGPTFAKKKANQEIDEAERARQAEAAKREREANKKKALESGSAADVLKFRGELTNQELQNVITRIDYEKKLSSIAASDTKSIWDSISDIADRTGRVVKLTEKGIDAWNVFAKISNAFSEDKLPLIGSENKKEDPEAKDKDKAIAKYMSNNGNLDQILKYAPQMSKTQLTDALSRIASAGDTKEEKERLNAIKEAIIDYGPDKKVFSVIDNWTVEDVQRYRKRKEKNKEDED